MIVITFLWGSVEDEHEKNKRYHPRTDFADNSKKCPQIINDPGKIEWRTEA